MPDHIKIIRVDPNTTGKRLKAAGLGDIPGKDPVCGVVTGRWRRNKAAQASFDGIPMLSVMEAVEVAHRTRRCVHGWIWDKKVPAVHPDRGCNWLLPQAPFMAWVRKDGDPWQMWADILNTREMKMRKGLDVYRLMLQEVLR